MNLNVLLSFCAGLTCFFFALLVLLKGIRNKPNRSFFIATVLTGLWTLFPFLTSLPKDNYTALNITRLLYIFASFVPTSWFYFMICILNSYKDKTKLYIFCFVSLIFAFFSFSPFFIHGISRFTPYFFIKPGFLYLFFMAFFGIVFYYVLFRLITALKNSQGYPRSRIIYLGWSYLIGAMSGIIHFIAAYTGKEPFPHDILILLYPLILSYAILKYRLMDISLAITRTTIFVLLYTLVWGLPFLLVSRGKVWLIKSFGLNWWFGPMILMAVLGTLGPFIYIYLQKRAEAVLLRQQHSYQKILREAAMGMSRIRNPRQLLKLIVDLIGETVYISHSAIYLFDKKKDQFILKEGRNLKKGQPLILDRQSPLIPWFKKHKDPLIYEETQQKAQEQAEPVFKEMAAGMHSLDAAVIVPSFLEDKLLGLIILGDKPAKKIYTPEDLNIFSVLANQAALAIENALLYEDIENQVKKRTEELVEVQKQLVQAEKLATVGTLAGGVAHEINNPLTAILTNVQMLLKSDELDKESLEMIEEATKRCRTIVQKLMVYAKKPQQEITAPSKINLLAILNNVVAFLKYQLEQENIRINVNDDGGAYLIEGVQNELEQVMTNIIINAKDAIKQIKKSGIIDLTLSHTESSVKIEIRDDGAGIPKDIINRIFDPFFTTKDVGKGLGLGLSICHSILEKHRGKISVHSEVNKGTVFTVILPGLNDISIANTFKDGGRNG